MNGIILTAVSGALIGLGAAEKNIGYMALGAYLLIIRFMLSLKGI